METPPTKAWALRRAAALLWSSGQERIARRRSQAGVPLDDATWLTDVLCAGVPGARVVSVVETGSSRGTTSRRSLRIGYNAAGTAAGLPARVFVKRTESLAQRLMIGLGALIEGEPGFYRDVRPLLDAVETPAAYYVDVDLRSWHSVVVLEDVVATRRARFWTPSPRGIGRDEIEDLLRQMAGWHGRLWDDQRLTQWRWLRSTADQARLIDALIGLADRRAAGLRRAGDLVPAWVRSRSDDLHEGMRRSMTEGAAGPRTFLHGDLHVANTYRCTDGRMGVTDWQVALQGSWAYDFAYLMATALEVEDRRAWEAELLGFYLEQLRAAGGPPLDRDAAWLAYRQNTFYPLFAWVYTLGRSRLQPRFQPDEVSLLMVRRIGAAIVDLDSLGAVGL